MNSTVQYQPNSGPPKIFAGSPLMVIYKKKLYYATPRGGMDF